ncbi:MAG: hypothetical protein IJ566_04510 [Cardiobacteriaceae bacterium]|nr:hypothetical protein [Cardiobacteriaceae bacterium]
MEDFYVDKNVLHNNIIVAKKYCAEFGVMPLEGVAYSYHDDLHQSLFLFKDSHMYACTLNQDNLEKYIDFSNEEKITVTLKISDSDYSLINYNKDGIIQDFYRFKNNNVEIFRFTNARADYKKSKFWKDGVEDVVNKKLSIII